MGDVEAVPSKAKVFYQGAMVHELSAGKEAWFGRHTECDIHLDGPRNDKNEPLLSRRTGVMWFRDGRLTVRNESSRHVLLVEAESGDSLRLEPRRLPSPGPEGSVAGELVQVTVLLHHWAPASTLQHQLGITVELPRLSWLTARVSPSDEDDSLSVTAGLDATSSEERVLAALCRRKVTSGNRDFPALTLDDIAYVTGLARGTVRGHLESLRAKNGRPPDKDVLATIAYERGWVTPEMLRRHGLLQ